MEQRKRAVVVTGGSLVDAITRNDLGPFDVLIAADSGVDVAHGLGLDPHVVVGDFDSVTEPALDYARRRGAMVVPVSRDKDFTDTELAIEHAVFMGASHITVVSSGGGRLDHTQGMVCSLANPMLKRIEVDAIIGVAHVSVLHGGEVRHVPRRGSEIIALHAMHGSAEGIVTSGLRWNLNDENLLPWTSRGVSNEMTAAVAEISLRSGVLAIIQPLAYDRPHSEKRMNGVFE
jgi:thiamine pyrophosphokinase